MAHRTSGAIGYPGNLFCLGALRNHPLRSANGTFAEFSRESCLNSHIMHVPFGQVRSRNLQPVSDAVIAVRYARICLEKIAGALPVSDTSAERSRHMRIVPPRDHNNTWTCAPTSSPQGEPMRTGAAILARSFGRQAWGGSLSRFSGVAVLRCSVTSGVDGKVVADQLGHTLDATKTSTRALRSIGRRKPLIGWIQRCV